MILVDTGPLIALLNRGDTHHDACVAAMKSWSKQALITTWPCLTETMHFLGRAGGYEMQSDLWSMWSNGSLILHEPTESEIRRMNALMDRYQDLPMDLADASLVALAEYKSMKQIFSCDGDFYVYQLADGSHLEVLPGPAV